AVEGHGLELGRNGSGRDHDVLRDDFLLRAVPRGVLDAITGQQSPVTLQSSHAGRLEESGDPLRRGLDDLRFALLHGRNVEAELADPDAVRAKLRVRAVIELGGL